MCSLQQAGVRLIKTIPRYNEIVGKLQKFSFYRGLANNYFPSKLNSVVFTTQRSV